VSGIEYLRSSWIDYSIFMLHLLVRTINYAPKTSVIAITCARNYYGSYCTSFDELNHAEKPDSIITIMSIPDINKTAVLLCCKGGGALYRNNLYIFMMTLII
jgi:hypothetical protein